MSKLEKIPEHAREEFGKEAMEGMAASASVECHVMFNVVFIGIVTSTGYGPQAAQRFLSEMHEAVTKHYTDNLVFIKRQ